MSEMNVELFEKLSRLQWLLHRHHLRTHTESGPMSDPTRGQGRIFAILKMKDGISTKDLSYLLGIRISSLNELLSKMARNGYITREPSEEDRRVMLIRLTEKGKNEPQREWNPDSIFSCLTDDEQTAFSDYLDRIIAALEEELGGEADEEEKDWWMNSGPKRMGEEMLGRFAAMRGGRYPHEWEAEGPHHPEPPHHGDPSHHPEQPHHGDHLHHPEPPHHGDHPHHPEQPHHGEEPHHPEPHGNEDIHDCPELPSDPEMIDGRENE